MMDARLVFLILMFSSVAFARPEILFDHEIEASARAKLTWADLATVREGTPELMSELASVAYDGGGATELRAKFRDRRAENDLYSRLSVKVSLPQTLTVRKVNGYSSVEFRRKLENRLGVVCAECRFDVRALRDEKVRLGGDWAMDESAVQVAGSMLVPVSEKGGATAWVPVTMKVSRVAPISKRTLILGQKIAADDFEMREADVTNLRGMLASTDDLIDAVSMRTIGAGQILTRGDIRAESAVKRGQPVKLVVAGDAYEITVNALAEQEGRVGDVVKIKNVESGRVLSALVTGRGEARLQ